MLRAVPVFVLAAFLSGCGSPPSGTSLESPTSGDQSASSISPAELTTGVASTPGLPAVSGTMGQSRYLKLAVVEAGFDPAAPPAPPGSGYYTVGLRGMGRARGNDFVLETGQFVFAQNERGCIARPVQDAAWLKRPMGETPVFRFSEQTAGQITFLVPDDSLRIRVLIAPAGDGGLVVPAGEDFTPTWSAPTHTIEDGSTLRVLVLPAPEKPPVLASSNAGREPVVLDFVIENLSSDQGIEFTTSQQLRLVDPTGSFLQPSSLTQQIGCRLDDGDVIPPGHVRRFMVAYEMPAGAPRRLQYRGFEVDEITVDLP
jgi:hypothetical protein